MLVVIGGLPGTGKSSLSRAVVRALGAVYLRIDTVEQALANSQAVRKFRGPEGYLIGYALAAENLRLDLTVVADCVNPLGVTRDAWRAVAERIGIAVAEVEVICSDPTEHRRRVESRISDIEGLALPTWQEVLQRDYEVWNREHLVIDTAAKSTHECTLELIHKLEVWPKQAVQGST